MQNVELPLSGDVNQTINPWTWWNNFRGSQLGLVNITVGRSPDPPLERQILEEVGSYGRQIGRIADTLAVLVHRTALLQRDDLTHEERAAVHDLLGQVEAVAAIKERRRNPLPAPPRLPGPQDAAA
ncbi:MAG TPA: hypothetical protein VE684_01935 [Crenalkalicoccus sp.]|nr:hypothetical protein [Crenalkalicoccus sp.]